MTIPGAIILVSVIVASSPGVESDAQQVEYRSPPRSVADNPYQMDARRTCGPLCVTFLSRYFDRPRAVADVIASCGVGPYGTNLKDLQSAARDMGLYAIGFESSVGDLRRLTTPAILHMKLEGGREHFVVLLGWDESAERFRLFDPPRFLAKATAEEFEQKYSGVGLMISDRPLPAIGMSTSEQYGRTLNLALLSVLAIIAISLTVGRRWRPARLRLLVVAIGLFACGACSRSRDIDSGAQTASYSSALDFDIGEIRQGTVMKHTFAVANTGPDAFHIIRVASLCGCKATVVGQQREVASGDSGVIEVEVPTTGLEGPVAKRFVVSTDSTDKAFREIELTLRATILTLGKAIPSEVNFGNVQSGEAASRRLLIQSYSPNFLDHFKSIESDDPHIRARLVSAKPGLLEFDLSWLADSPCGDLVAHVTAHFEDSRFPTIDIPLLGRRAGDIRIVPSRLRLNRSATTWPQKFRVRATSATGGAFSLEPAKLPPEIEVACESHGSEQSSWDVLVSVARPPESTVAQYVVLQTDREEQGRLVIPVFSSK